MQKRKLAVVGNGSQGLILVKRKDEDSSKEATSTLVRMIEEIALADTVDGVILPRARCIIKIIKRLVGNPDDLEREWDDHDRDLERLILDEGIKYLSLLILEMTDRDIKEKKRVLSKMIDIFKGWA